MTNSVHPEIWKPIPGYPDYEVSDLGRVRRATDSHHSKKGRILKATPDDSGYLRVCLYHPPNGKRRRLEQVHRLVCRAFKGPPPTPKHEVAHGDGLPNNCRADNVRWATRKENHADKRKHGTEQIGERNGNAQLNARVVAAIRRTYRKGKFGLARTGIMYGVGKRTVSQIVGYETWKHVA